MTNEQIDKEAEENIIQKDGMYMLDWKFIKRMNEASVYFMILKEGIRWQREPFNTQK